MRGEVRIKNTGDMNGRFTLIKHALADPGARSSWLQVRVHDISSAGAPAPVYEGSLAAMPAATRLSGEFGPNEQRHYRFRAKFEPPSEAPGAHAAATTSVAFTWEAVAEAPAPPAPAPAPPTPPRAPARPPAPAPPAPAKTPAKAPARAPSRPKSCAKKVSARKMTAAAKRRALAACKKKPTKKAAKSKRR